MRELLDFFDEAFLDPVLFLDALLFVPVDLRDEDFVPELRFVLDDFFDEDFFDADFLEPPLDFFDEDLRDGVLSPSARASEIPMAIACLRLVTFLPELLFNFPSPYSCIVLLTLFCAFFP